MSRWGHSVGTVIPDHAHCCGLAAGGAPLLRAPGVWSSARLPAPATSRGALSLCPSPQTSQSLSFSHLLPKPSPQGLWLGPESQEETPGMPGSGGRSSGSRSRSGLGASQPLR